MSAPRALAVTVSRTREGGLIVAVRYSYEGKVPSFKKRAEMARAMLREAAERLESGEHVDIGFSQDSVRCVRTDRMEV
jgi:hypothetical protein